MNPPLIRKAWKNRVVSLKQTKAIPNPQNNSNECLSAEEVGFRMPVPFQPHKGHYHLWRRHCIFFQIVCPCPIFFPFPQ